MEWRRLYNKLKELKTPFGEPVFLYGLLTYDELFLDCATAIKPPHESLDITTIPLNKKYAMLIIQHGYPIDDSDTESMFEHITAITSNLELVYKAYKIIGESLEVRTVKMGGIDVIHNIAPEDAIRQTLDILQSPSVLIISKYVYREKAGRKIRTEIVERYAEPLRTIVSYEPYYFVLKDIIESMEDSRNIVRKRTVKPTIRGKGYGVALGVPKEKMADKYRRYVVFSGVDNIDDHVVVFTPKKK